MLLKAGADPNIIAFLEDDEASALDAVISDYCDCDTDKETDQMIEIERMIRAAGGRVHTSGPRSGHFPDWQYLD